MGAEYAAAHDRPGAAGEDLRLQHDRLPLPPPPAPGARGARGTATPRTRPTTSRRAWTWVRIPEAFLGLHPSIAEDGNHEVLLPYLERWDSDLIVRHSRAYTQVAEEGFHIPSGVLHATGERAHDRAAGGLGRVRDAPGARTPSTIISKDLLWKDVRPEDREAKGERFILELIDWEENGDPHFYEHHHLSPQPIEGSRQRRRRGAWIFYETTKFSGKKLVVRPGRLVRDHGSPACTTSSSGRVSGHLRRARGAGRRRRQLDELLVTHDRAVAGVEVRNTGRGPARDQVLRSGRQPGRPDDPAALSRGCERPDDRRGRGRPVGHPGDRQDRSRSSRGRSRSHGTGCWRLSAAGTRERASDRRRESSAPLGHDAGYEELIEDDERRPRVRRDPSPRAPGVGGAGRGSGQARVLREAARGEGLPMPRRSSRPPGRTTCSSSRRSRTDVIRRRQRWSRLLRDGAIGEIRMIDAVFGYDAGPDPGTTCSRASWRGGGILDVGCYTTSMAHLVAAAAAGARDRRDRRRGGGRHDRPDGRRSIVGGDARRSREACSRGWPARSRPTSRAACGSYGIRGRGREYRHHGSRVGSAPTAEIVRPAVGGAEPDVDRRPARVRRLHGGGRCGERVRPSGGAVAVGDAVGGVAREHADTRSVAEGDRACRYEGDDEDAGDERGNRR